VHIDKNKEAGPNDPTVAIWSRRKQSNLFVAQKPSTINANQNPPSEGG